jgi:hypothetical protein
LSENHLDTHLINIARLSLDYFTRRGGKSHASCPPSPHSEAETGLKAPPSIHPCHSVGGHSASGRTVSDLADFSIHSGSA